jgi:hypothetical protein
MEIMGAGLPPQMHSKVASPATGSPVNKKTETQLASWRADILTLQEGR